MAADGDRRADPKGFRGGRERVDIVRSSSAKIFRQGVCGLCKGDLAVQPEVYETYVTSVHAAALCLGGDAANKKRFL